MSTFSRYLIFIGLVSVCLSCGCGQGVTSPSIKTFPVVVFSDVHFNPFYDPTLCTQLLAANASDWEGIFQSSLVTTPATWGTDTNYPSLVLALSGIKQNLGTSTVVIFTGDLLGHNISTLLNQDCGTQNAATLQAFSDKIVAFVTGQIRASVGTLPVMFVVGNSDSYTGLGPDSTFLSDNAELYYTNMLNSTVDHQTFLNSFNGGGYYSAEPAGKNLMVIGLNTNPFAVLPPQVPINNESAVAAELAWLDTTLSIAQASGKKVWLLMHIPPGADTVTSAANYSANGSLTTATAPMMWMPAYQENFLTILAKYPGLITLTLAAHTHRDEFRIMSSTDALDITPSISPCFGNNPAFKVFTFNQITFTPTDYRSLNYDLATLPAGFNSYYTFSEAYSMQGSLDAFFAKLYPALVAKPATQALYSVQYNSGNNSINPATSASWNPVTVADWPVFACGAGVVSQTDFIACVNSY